MARDRFQCWAARQKLGKFSGEVVRFLYMLFSQVRGDNFVGCAFDEDNQPDESEERANKWVEQIKGEGIAI